MTATHGSETRAASSYSFPQSARGGRVTVRVIRTSNKTVDARWRNVLIFLCLELLIATVGFCVALRAYLFTANQRAGCFWAQAGLALASLFTIIAVAKKQKGRGLMVCGLVFNAIGIFLCFVGVIIDAVQAGHVKNTDFSECEHTKAATSVYCNSGAAHLPSCELRLSVKTCYCCSVYKSHNCAFGVLSLSTKPITYENVNSCRSIQGDYQNLMWTSFSLLVLNLIVAMANCALVSTYRTHLAEVSPAATPVREIIEQTTVNTASRERRGPVTLYPNEQRATYNPHLMQLPPPPAYSEDPPVEPPSIFTVQTERGASSPECAPQTAWGEASGGHDPEASNGALPFWPDYEHLNEEPPPYTPYDSRVDASGGH